MSAQAIEIGTNAADNIFTLTFANQVSNIAVAGTITSADTVDTVTVNVWDSDHGRGPQTTTFNREVRGIDTLNVGRHIVTQGGTTVAQAGSAVFGSAVDAGTIAVWGGNHADEDSSVEFRGAVTSTNLNINGSATAATGATASVTFTGGARITGGTITLNDGANSGGAARVAFANTEAEEQGAAIKRGHGWGRDGEHH